MNEKVNGEEHTIVQCDLESLTKLALLYGAAIGKLLLMRDMHVFDGFWHDDVDDLIKESEQIKDFVIGVIQLNDGLESAIKKSVH